MRTSFDPAFDIVIGLEDKLSVDQDDPGNKNSDGSPGFTIWGLASRYNIGISPNTTKEDAKAIYYNKYWIPAGCNDVGFPLDICLFDGRVNGQDDPLLPGAGNQELLNLKPESWHEFLLMRAARYMRCSKPKYAKGHVFRILRLYQAIKNLKPGY